MGLFKVVYSYNYGGQGCMNRWWYFAPTLAANSSDLADSFGIEVLNSILNVQAQNTEAVELRVTSLDNPADETIVDMDGINGVRTGEDSGQFTAWSFKLQVGSGDVRSGGKRIGGVSENDTLFDDAKQGFKDLWLKLVANHLSEVLTYDGVNYAPVIVRLVGAGVYLISQVIDAKFSYSSTQNSRKRYSGGGPLTTSFVTDGTLVLVQDGNIEAENDSYSQPSELFGGVSSAQSYASWLAEPNERIYGLWTLPTVTAEELN